MSNCPERVKDSTMTHSQVGAKTQLLTRVCKIRGSFVSFKMKEQSCKMKDSTLKNWNESLDLLNGNQMLMVRFKQSWNDI
jgi:hypothetical protein